MVGVIGSHIDFGAAARRFPENVQKEVSTALRYCCGDLYLKCSFL